jgi:hypothetical protein
MQSVEELQFDHTELLGSCASACQSSCLSITLQANKNHLQNDCSLILATAGKIRPMKSNEVALGGEQTQKCEAKLKIPGGDMAVKERREFLGCEHFHRASA